MHALLRLLLLPMLCAFVSPWAWGQAWAPNKPVRLIKLVSRWWPKTGLAPMGVWGWRP